MGGTLHYGGPTRDTQGGGHLVIAGLYEAGPRSLASDGNGGFTPSRIDVSEFAALDISSRP